MEYKLKNKRYLNINLYEIRLEDDINDFIYNKDLLKPFLFDCQCALFFIDITNYKSFDLVKEFISKIDKTNYPYLKIIIVENKSDLINVIDNEEYQKYKNNEPNIDYIIKISLKTGDNLDQLINQIYNEVNPSSSGKNLLPINQVAKFIHDFKNKIEKCKSALSLILLGSVCAGKTSFFDRYFKNIFNKKTYPMIGIDKEIKILKIMKHYYKFIIWDTPGQKSVRSLQKKYIQNADGILIFFDINDNYSFEDISDWMKQIKENSIEDNIIYIIGNKIDKNEEKISKEEIKKLAKKFRCKYYEISCRWDLNIEEIIARITLECYQKQLKTHDVQIEKILDEDFLEYAKYKKKKLFSKLEKYIDF